MKNRSLVITLTVAYAGLVCGAIALRSPANLLGSTLNFFTEPTAIEQLGSFDANDDAVPDFMNAERILEIFVSAPQWLTPLMGQPFMMPGMIRIDERFFTMPGDHAAAPAVSTEEDNPVFDTVEPLWTSDTIELSPEFEGGERSDEDVPAPFLVPSISPSSSLPASLMMPTAPTTPTAPSSTPPAVTAPAAATAPSSTGMNSCNDAMNPDGDSMMDMSDMDGGTECDTVGASSGGSSSAIDSCSDGMNPDGDSMMDMSDMDGGTECDTVGASSGGSSSTVNSCTDGMNMDGDMFMDMADMDGGSMVCDSVGSFSGGSSSTLDSCSDGMNPDGDSMMDMSDMDGGTECDTIGTSSVGFMPF